MYNIESLCGTLEINLMLYASYISIKRVLTKNIGVRRGSKHREEYLMKTQREESHVKKKAEITVMLPQAKECLEPPKDEKDKERFSFGAFTRSMALETP